MGSHLQANKASSVSPISWHGDSDMGVQNDKNKTVSQWPSEEKGTNFLDILELAEKEASKKSDMLKIADKSDFLKRMNLDKYTNISDLDKLCVYQMKRKLVETVIEEQYAMDNTEKETEHSVPLLVQVGAANPEPQPSPVEKPVRSPVVPPVEKEQSYFDKIIMDQFEKKDTDSDMDDVFIDVDDSGIPDAVLRRQNERRKDDVNLSVARFVSETNDIISNLSNKTDQSSKSLEKPDCNNSRFATSPQPRGGVTESDLTQPETWGQNQEQASPVSTPEAIQVESHVENSSFVGSPQSSCRSPTTSPKSDSQNSHEVFSENQVTKDSNTSKFCVAVGKEKVNDNDHVDVVNVSDLAKCVKQAENRNDIEPKSLQTQSTDNVQSNNMKDVSGEGFERSPVPKNVPLVQNLSGSMLHARHHEPIRRQRGRRKPHLPLQCRKRTYYPENDVHISPPNHQLGQHHHPKHSFPSWPPGVPSTESLEPYSILNYMYQYTSNTPGNPPQNSFPLSMAMPLMSAYPLSLNGQVIPSQISDGQPSIEAMQYFNKPDNADSILPGIQSSRPPFASHRYDAACDQYPVPLNKLFHQMCAGTNQPQNISEKSAPCFPPSTYPKASMASSVPKQTEKTLMNDNTTVRPTSKESSQNTQTVNSNSNTNSKKDTTSNDELTQYFNLLFNPSYSRPSDRIGHRGKSTGDKSSSPNVQQDKEKESSVVRSGQSSTQECPKMAAPPKILAAIDLTNDDSPETVEKGVENIETAAVHSGILPININDEMWSVQTSSIPEACRPGASDSDPIVIDCGTPSEDTSQDSTQKVVQPVKPYEPKFFQSLPQSDIEKMSLLESLKKWTVNDGEDKQDQGDLASLEGEGHCQGESQGQGQGEGIEVEKNDSEGKQEGVKKGENMVPVLDAMHQIISGLLDRGAIDLSLATKSANKLFRDKLNGIPTPCNCTYRKRPAQMSRSMAARANALSKAAMKQGQAPPVVVRSSVPTGLPMRSPHRSQVVFPEMIHQEQQRLANRPKEVTATISKPPSSPPKKAVKMPTSTIKHYGPMQMLGANFSKQSPSKDPQTFSSPIETKSAEAANLYQQHPRFVYGNLGQCLDMQAQALLGKSRQVPFVDYSPLSMFPANAHAMYSEYLMSQKRSLEALQGPFCLPPPLPLKRQRLLFGDEGNDSNGQPLCSV